MYVYIDITQKIIILLKRVFIFLQKGLSKNKQIKSKKLEKEKELLLIIVCIGKC